MPEVHHRALQEPLLAAAAAELAADVAPLALHYAQRVAGDPAAAQGLVACMVRPELVERWWQDIAVVLRQVPLTEQLRFVLQVGDFAVHRSCLVDVALELWIKLWPQALGDEDLALMLEQLVQASTTSEDRAQIPLDTPLNTREGTMFYQHYSYVLYFVTIPY